MLTERVKNNFDSKLIYSSICFVFVATSWSRGLNPLMIPCIICYSWKFDRIAPIVDSCMCIVLPFGLTYKASWFLSLDRNCDLMYFLTNKQHILYMHYNLFYLKLLGLITRCTFANITNLILVNYVISIGDCFDLPDRSYKTSLSLKTNIICIIL